MRFRVLLCDAVCVCVGHVEVNNEAQQAKLTERLRVFLAIGDKQMRRICDGDDHGCNWRCARSQSTDIPFQWPLAGLSNPDARLSDALHSGSGRGLDNSQKPSRAGVVKCWTAVRMRTQQSISVEK